jgi:N-acetylneuraminic acid mutarotase
MVVRLLAGGIALAGAALLLVLYTGSPGARSERAQAAPWTRAPAMSHRRSYVAAAEWAGKIYVAGGMVGETGRHLAVFQRFDPRRGAWTTLPRLPEPIRAGAAAAVNGWILVIGGSTPGGGGRQVFAYDVVRGRWERRAPLPEARYNHAAVALGDTVYVLGGVGGHGERSEVFAYDPRRDAWSDTTELPKPMHAFGAVVFRGRIWAIGGRRDGRVLRSVWVYDPARGRWQRGPSLPKPMELLGATVAGDEIHAVWEGTYQIFDGRLRTWRQGPAPLVTRHALSAFAVGQVLYTVGGCTTALRDTQVVERRQLAPGI